MSVVTYYPSALDLSTDDDVWAARVPVSELFNILYNPVNWALTSNKCEKHYLKSPFTIRIEPLVMSEDGGAVADYILVQSIDNTSLMVIQASMGAADAFQRQFQAMLESVKTQREEAKAAGVEPPPLISFPPALLEFIAMLAQQVDQVPDKIKAIRQSFSEKIMNMTFMHDEGRAFAHFDIWSPDGENAGGGGDKLLTVALFHLWSTTDPTFLPKALAAASKQPGCKTWCYRGKPQKRKEDYSGPIMEPDSQKAVVFKAAPAAVGSGKGTKTPPTVPLLFLGDCKANDGESTMDDSEAACELLVAEYTAGDPNVTYAEAYSKPYSG